MNLHRHPILGDIMITNNSSTYSTVFSELIPKEYNLSTNEVDWITRASEGVKLQKNHRDVQLTLSDQVQKLQSFEAEKIFCLVDILRKVLQQEKHQQKTLNFLSKSAAALMAEKSSELLYPFLSKHTHNPLMADMMVELAKKGHDPLLLISKYNLDFTSETSDGKNAILAIAKAAFSRSIRMMHLTADSLARLGLTINSPLGQSVMIEIAKMAVQQDCYETVEYIQEYGIDTLTTQGQQGLIEIAQIVAKIDGESISEHIQQFGIHNFPDGQNDLIEIAKLAAQQDGRSISRYIRNYGIDASTPQGQKAIFEIAKLAAMQDGYGTSDYIQNYGMSAFNNGQDLQIEIAKIAAQQNGTGTSMYIERYYIDRYTPEGQKGLIEIAKLAAQQNGAGIAEFFQKYRINISTSEGRKAIFDILKLAIQQNASGSCSRIEEFFSDPYSLEEIIPDAEIADFIFQETVNQMSDFAFQTLVVNFQPYAHFISKYSIKSYVINPAGFMQAYKKLFSGDILGTMTGCLKACEKKYKMPTSDLEWFQKSLQSKELFIQTHLLNWFMTTATLCSARKDLIEGFKARQDIIKEISKLHPSLRVALVKEFMHVYHVQNTRGWEILTEASEGIAHLKLASLVFANFPPSGEEAYRKALLVLKQEREFREGKYQKLLLETLIKLEKCSLEEAEKISLVAMLFEMSTEARIQAFTLVSDILAFQGHVYLKKAKDIAELKFSLESLFRNIFSIKLDNFAYLYENSIGKWRNKEALITYAGKLNELPSYQKHSALRYFQKLLEQILQGSFQIDRYAVENNPHMAIILENYPELYKKWQVAAALEASEIKIGEKDKRIPVKDRVIHTLKLSLEQNHLGGEKQDKQYPLVNACLGHWDQLGVNLEKVNEALVPLSDRRLSPEELQKKSVLLLQKKLLELLQDPGN